MANQVFDDRGVRFRYPEGWELEVGDDGPRTTVTVQSPEGPAFALVAIDEAMPDPEELVEEAVAALREEYPELDVSPTGERIAGYPSVAQDVEFISLDMTNTCALRCVQTPRRTVFVLSQWSDLEDNAPGDALAELRRSLEETDA